MRHFHLSIIFVTVVLIVVGANWYFQAEAVEHHGYNVDNVGSRSYCIKCHDDVMKYRPKCMPICFFGENHPDNADYPPPNKINEFKAASVAELNGAKFIDGKMGCTSCHSLQVKSRYHLRIKNWQQQLCYTCHNKEGERNDYKPKAHP